MTNLRFEAVLRHVRGMVEEPALANASDGQLLERFCARREEAAFTALLRRHGPLGMSVCRRRLAHEQDCEDVFQATFLLLVRRAGSIRKRESVSSWLHGVAHRLALKCRADEARRRLHESQATDLRDPCTTLPTA
jgi:DNA-directed RNA polymerase specialized sigma24 family protein